MLSDIPNSRLLRKTRLKFLVRRWLGEPYVGKRLKMRCLRGLLRGLDLPSNAKVLDVGCEDGTFTEWLTRVIPGSTVTGMDAAAAQAAAASEWSKLAGRSEVLRFEHCNVLDLDSERCYDLVTCLDMLGYVQDDRGAIHRMANAIKPGGWLVVHQPNVTYRTVGGRLQYVPPEKAGEITEGHIRHGYSPSDFRELIGSVPSIRIERMFEWNGPLSDVAHRVYRLFERPYLLRLLCLPILDLLSFIDRRIPTSHGNTLCIVARRHEEGRGA